MLVGVITGGILYMDNQIVVIVITILRIFEHDCLPHLCVSCFRSFVQNRITDVDTVSFGTSRYCGVFGDTDGDRFISHCQGIFSGGDKGGISLFDRYAEIFGCFAICYTCFDNLRIIFLILDTRSPQCNGGDC